MPSLAPARPPPHLAVGGQPRLAALQRRALAAQRLGLRGQRRSARLLRRCLAGQLLPLARLNGLHGRCARLARRHVRQAPAGVSLRRLEARAARLGVSGMLRELGQRAAQLLRWGKAGCRRARAGAASKAGRFEACAQRQGAPGPASAKAVPPRPPHPSHLLVGVQAAAALGHVGAVTLERPRLGGEHLAACLLLAPLRGERLARGVWRASGAVRTPDKWVGRQGRGPVVVLALWPRRMRDTQLRAARGARGARTSASACSSLFCACSAARCVSRPTRCATRPSVSAALARERAPPPCEACRACRGGAERREGARQAWAL
jgi:hypothetical protein